VNILVTGATGFLGTALCRELKRQGHNVVELNSRNCDLTNDKSLDNFQGMTYGQIFHLAAWTQAGDFCLNHPGEQWIINQQINTNILKWWARCQPQAKLICMGTSCAYAPEMELKEENYLAGMPIDSLFTYAMTKRMLYVGLLALRRQFGLRYLCLVPSTLYGPGYHTDGRQLHFVFDLIRKIIRGKLVDDPVVLWGDGNQKRELVYVDDFVNIAIGLAGRVDNDLINIGAGEEYSIQEFAALICDRVGYDQSRIEYDTTRYVGARSKRLEIGKLRSYMPPLRMTELKVGLARTIDWCHEQIVRL